MQRILYSQPRNVIFDYYAGMVKFRLPVFNHNIPVILHATPFMSGEPVLSIKLEADPIDYYFVDDKSPEKVSELFHRLK